MKKILLIAAISIVYNSFIFSQEMLGIVSSNYSGTSGIQLNPSSMVGSPLKWDINILTLDVFFDNNYLYQPNSNTFLFLNSAANSGSLVPNGNHSENQDALLKRYKNNHRKYANLQLTVRPPAGMFTWGNQGIGFHTAVRSAFSVNRLHPSLAEAGYLGFDNPEVQNIRNVSRGGRINFMTWSEVGVSYARILTNNKFQTEKVGITLKYCQGLAATYFNMKQFTFTITPDPIPTQQDLLIENANANYGYTDFNSYDGSFSSWLKGTGGGIDIGYTYEKKNSFRPRYKFTNAGPKKRFYKNNYQWKLGVSLIDVGMIHFGKDASAFKLDNVQSDWYRIDTSSFTSLTDVDTSLSIRFYDAPQISKTGSAFNMWLPTALSIQYDFYVADFFYINSTLIQRIPHFKMPGVDRVNLFSITPRYETRWLELAIPVVLYQYQDPRIGLAARFGWLAIGTDKLGGFVGKHDYTGFDFYMAIKIMGFNTDKKIKSGENRKSFEHEAKTRPAMPCYHFKPSAKSIKSKKTQKSKR